MLDSLKPMVVVLPLALSIFALAKRPCLQFMQKPFTAARARNQGTMRLREIAPEVEFIQFVDGDCEIIDGWLERAMASLVAAPTVAVVCGRLRERYPDKSIYNLLCDM